MLFFFSIYIYTLWRSWGLFKITSKDHTGVSLIPWRLYFLKATDKTQIKVIFHLGCWGWIPLRSIKEGEKERKKKGCCLLSAAMTLRHQFSHLTFPKTHSTLAVMKHCVSSHYVTYLLSDGNWSEAWRKWGRLPCCYGKCSPKWESTKFTCGLKWGKLMFIHWNGSSQLLLILAVHSTSIEWLLCGWQVVGTRAIGEIGKTEHLPQTHVLFFLFFLFLVGNSLFFSGEPWLIHLQYVRLSIYPITLKNG